MKPRRNKNGKTAQQRQTQNLRMFGKLQDPGFTVRRVMCLADQSLSTSVAGIIAATGLCSSNTATVTPDWTSATAMWSSFRVHRIKIQWEPAYPVNTTAITVPAALWMIPFYGGVVPTTIAGFADSSGVRQVSGYRGGTMTVDFLTMAKDGDSHLWTPTNTTIPTSEQYGLAVMGSATASTASTLVWKYSVWLDVELKVNG